MKKLTVALIAVFLFPASFALGGEHPAFANERPSLVNDDLAFAFHGDVPLQTQFLSEEEMQKITGEAIIPVLLVILEYTIQGATGKGSLTHALEIRRRAAFYLGYTKFQVDEAFGTLENPKTIPEAILHAEMTKMQSQIGAASLLAQVGEVLYKAIRDHIRQEIKNAKDYDDRMREDFYREDFDSEAKAEFLKNQIMAEVRTKLNNMLHPKTSTTTQNRSSLPNGGWLLEEEGEEYDQSELSQLYMPLSDGHIYSLYGYNFGGIGVQTGSSSGNRTGGHQTFSCTGNSCTLTVHRSPSRGSRSPSVSRQPTNVSLF
ncbi:MAG: hypothetical protein ISN29_08990 [Gammaproteobacteria bacterium AqS3]|nr:hypothetical protein [Gammaproteobacteria bacterium AqS3]